MLPEDSLLELLRFLEDLARIFLIFFSSKCKPAFLEMLQRILFLFLRAFRSFFHLCSDFLYCFKELAILSSAPPSPTLMDFWLERLPKYSSELCTIYFYQVLLPSCKVQNIAVHRDTWAYIFFDVCG